jgi:hypothetical protein
MAEGGIRLAAEGGEELLENAAMRLSKENPDISSMMIRPTVEAQVSDLVSNLVEQKKISPGQAKQTVKLLMARAKPGIQKQESEAYRREAGQRVMAPSTIGETATAATLMTALPWALSRGSYLWGQKPKDPMTLGQAFKFNFVPSFLPFAVGFEALGHALAPLSDPQRKNKERGYWRSVGESYEGARDYLAERGAEARARFGPFGIPLQMFHGIMNPIASLAYLGQQVGGAFKKPDYVAWARQAAEKRKALQEAGRPAEP